MNGPGMVEAQSVDVDGRLNPGGWSRAGVVGRRAKLGVLMVMLVVGSGSSEMVRAAAPSSGGSSPATGPRLRTGAFALSADDRAYWAFQPVRRPAVPTVRDRGARHPVDAFLAARLEPMGLGLSGPALPREQVRRLYLDLTGLPPSPDVVAAFARDPSDAAWEAMVDRLLASPQYGERWGRHWLDLVRYAESNGYERDGAKPDAWRYRDYVVEAFNADVPYDRFIREQLAGDELADEQLAGRLGAGSAEWRAAITATGFYRLHVWDDEPDSTVKAEFDDLDDILVTTGTAFLGLTIGCARCHDHKYDPISQAEYYGMLGFIRSIEPYGLHHTGGGGRGTGRIQRVLASDEEVRAWEEARRQRVKALEAELAQLGAAGPGSGGGGGGGGGRSELEQRLKTERAAVAPFDRALAVAEGGREPKPTRLLARGDAFSPREEVPPGFPVVLGGGPSHFPERPASARTTGRRSILADWVASGSNPLTARVMVNRIWQRHFGVGLVPTPDDFGRTGVAPTHLELLDYLAAEFVAGGWSVKRMHRLVATSRAYRMSSRAGAGKAVEVDEPNQLYWRQNLRRVEAEVVRDSMLAVAGTLNLKRGGPSVYPTLPREVHGTQDAAGKGWADSAAEEQNRRSLYLVVKRALKVPFLECLDFANSASATGTRPVTTTAPQALMLLNDGFVQAQAAALAERIERDSLAGGRVDGGGARRRGGVADEARIERAFALVLQREPTREERRVSRAMLKDQRDRLAAEGLAEAEAERGAWRSFCRGLLNLNELVYVD